MPREVHETYTLDPDNPDGDGVLTGYVVVTRESEWDDNTRARALALIEYEDSLCRCGCGLPRREAHRKQPFMVHTYTCYAQKAAESKRRADHDAAKDTKEPGWDDGLHYVAVPAKESDKKRIPEVRRRGY